MKGPPISIDIIPATTIPNNTLLVPPIELRKCVIASFIPPKKGFTNIMIAPIKPIPISGYNKVGFKPSNACGNLSNIFFNPNTK